MGPNSELGTAMKDLSAGMYTTAAATKAAESIPQIRGAKEIASRVNMPKSYEAEKGMKKGGPTSLDRKKFGKNLSRAMNQKGSSRGK